MTISVPTQAFREAKWIVSPTVGQGTHTTIAAALTSASSGDTIFIRDGTYTENLTLKAGVHLTSYTAGGLVNPNANLSPITNATSNVVISGKLSASFNGSCSITGITFSTNSDYILETTGANGTGVNFESCFFNVINNDAFNLTGTGGGLILKDCNLDINTNTSGSTSKIFTVTNSNHYIYNCTFLQQDGSASSSTVSGGSLNFSYSTFFQPLILSSSGSASYIHTNTNSNITMSGTGTFTGLFASIGGGDGTAALTVGAGCTAVLQNCEMNSAAANVITGAGTVTYGGTTFVNTRTTNVTSESYYPLTVKQGGTNASTFTAYAPVIAGTTATGAFQSASTGLGTAGFVLTSNGSAAVPSFQAVATGGVTWTDVTGASQTIAAANGYITNRGGGVTYTLPASGTLGDTFKIVGKAGLATITPNANQQLLIGSASGAVGATGTAVANDAGDCIEFVCTTSGASTVWRADSVVGTWTLTT